MVFFNYYHHYKYSYGTYNKEQHFLKIIGWEERVDKEWQMLKDKTASERASDLYIWEGKQMSNIITIKRG